MNQTSSTEINSADKNTILKQLKESSTSIAEEFDSLYSDDLDGLAEELSICFNNLHGVINRVDQSQISDNDFQSALLFWTALNTIMAGVELLRRGYSKEPHMLLRNAVESFSAAYDIHVHPEKFIILRDTPKKFDSTRSITVAKSIHPFIGEMYGMFSDRFTHVSAIHTLPHGPRFALAIGGIFDPEEDYNILAGWPAFILSVDLLSSIIELTFFNEIKNHRHWTKIDETAVRPALAEPIKDRGKKLMTRMAQALQIKGYKLS